MSLRNRERANAPSRVLQSAARQEARRAARFLLFAITLLSAGGCAERGVERGASLTAFTRHLDDRVPALMRTYDVSGVSMALVREDTVAWTAAYGVSNVASGRTLRVDAVFRMESITKAVTAWGVMNLVEETRVDLNEPLEKYLGAWELPDSKSDEDGVTLRRLLSHSSGMPRGPIGEGARYDPGSTVPSLRAYLSREARLDRMPGSGFSYSNVGFDLLQLLIESVTGRDFSEYMADEVLRPLWMHDSRFGWAESLRSRVPTGYEHNGTPVSPHVHPAQAAGGLYATVEDIARFVCADLGDSSTVLSSESIRILHTPQVEASGLYGVVADDYGFGHFLEALPNGDRAVWHGGQGHGWMTHFHAVPATGDGLVILTNSERSLPLIAQVLSDWSQWSGVAAVKLSRLTHATIALWVLVGVVLLVALWLMYGLIDGLRTGTRQWARLSELSRPVHLLQALLGLGGIVALAWAAAQPDLMVTLIFPVTAPWAGASLWILAVLLVTDAVLPRVAE